MKHYLVRTLLLIVMTASVNAHAVTLGQIHVKSFLGESLNAEIDLIGLAPGQHEDLRLRIANDRHFERLGIAHTQYLTTLKFDVVQSGNRWIVRVRSSRAVAEPFLDFPLQMSWPGGRLIKQYTLLLDPPQRIRPAKRTTRSRRATPPATSSTRARVDADASSYGPVQHGESLWPIAKKLRPGGITTRQMAMALLRANPAAFIDGDINKLRAGATLTIPQRVFIEELDAETARAEFTAQTRRWQAPVATSPRVVEAPAPIAPVQPTIVDSEPEPVAEPPAAKPPVAEETAQEPGANAQLRIVTDPEKSDAEKGSQQNLQEQLLVTMEEIESNRITTGAIEARLKRMEAELDRMQKLVELKDAQIATMQSDAAAKKAIQEAAKIAEPPPPVAATDARPIPQTSTAAAKSTPAPISMTRIEPIPVSTTPTARPWYEEYIWVLWIVLGLMGVIALLMLFRRPQAVPHTAPMAELPEIESSPRQPEQTPVAPPAAEMKEAEEDFRRLADQPLVEETAATDVEHELPELDISPARQTDGDIRDGITDSHLNALLDDDKLVTDSPASTTADTAEFSDDDIASWVAELGGTSEQTDTPSANDERIPEDDDIPSILTELDDQLAADKPAEVPPGANVQLDPVDEIQEDDTFSMSLDLARAYLEIDDREGAKDMLKQALSGARDPEHRRQIEELLAQID